MKGLRFVPLVLAGLPVLASAQTIRSGYVDWGLTGTNFPEALETWEKGQKWTEDDNFFISRVKPKERFRNRFTQVNVSLNESNDKKLMYWVPINSRQFNALPDGAYDREVFPMWQYVTHFGNWSTSLVRIPGGVLDVAHKNGVPVTPVASVPWGQISASWRAALEKLCDVGARKLADYLLAYGVDGIGYNSEFSCPRSLVTNLGRLHEDLYSIMRGNGENPFAEVIWYDGTATNGNIQFDKGLGTHNSGNFGSSENIRSSLFFNYNWNDEDLLQTSVETANSLGRSPLDLYCGINMQGREPQIGTPIWTMLAQYPLSIGLWGAHDKSMFYESRAERGGTPEQCQRTYLERVENWFTGSTHNPVTSPELGNSLIYSSQNEDFMGMSKMMSARSSLKWDLSEEPFISYFNLGNGKFFNYKGERAHNAEWYNIAIQDYLPTWRWWFSTKLLGRNPADVPTDGLKAEFVWDDAWMGGSTIRIHGTTENEYIHLFKTEFELKDGDEITFRYKPIDGVADGFLAITLKGSEDTPIDFESLRVMNRQGRVYDQWVEKKFVVGRDFNVPAGSETAMIALKFYNAENLDLRLGEFSIVRKDAMKHEIATPVIENTELLSSRHDGYDGKIIFNMPNDKPAGEVCYNLDVNTSMFKLYAQQEGEEPVLMGMTTSWAGLVFSAPYNDRGAGNVRFGVSALTLDHEAESEIAWGEYQGTTAKYEVSDKLVKSYETLRPGEAFTIGYADLLHENADWKLLDAASNVVLESKDTDKLEAKNGLSTPGIYTLVLNGYEASEVGRVRIERELKGYVQVIDDALGQAPRIFDMTADNTISSTTTGDDLPLYVFENSDAELSFTADLGEANVSRGVAVGKDGFGFRFKESGLNPEKSFSVSFWMRPESFENQSVHMLNIRHKGDPWVKNNWGWFWHSLNEDGTTAAFTIRMLDGANASYTFRNFRLFPGAWTHMAYVFEFDENGGVRPSVYVNGERQEIVAYSLGEERFEGEPEFVGPSAEWQEENVLALGGYVHATGSVNCNLDNFMVWNKAMTADDVKAAMGDIAEGNVPSGAIGYFDFETNADSAGLFTNKGMGSFKAGMHDYLDTEVEGQGELRWKAPVFVSGSPFVKGKGFKIATDAVWSAPGGKIRMQEINSDGGKARMEYFDSEMNHAFADGYPVKLTLRNEYGEDSRDLILRFNHTGVRANKTGGALKVYPTVFDKELNITAPEAGNISVSLFSLDGKKVHADNFECESSDSLKIYPQVAPGMYIVSVDKEGHNLGSSRVMKQ